jgi:hypothetical protein
MSFRRDNLAFERFRSLNSNHLQGNMQISTTATIVFPVSTDSDPLSKEGLSDRTLFSHGPCSVGFFTTNVKPTR